MNCGNTNLKTKKQHTWSYFIIN